MSSITSSRSVTSDSYHYEPDHDEIKHSTEKRAATKNAVHSRKRNQRHFNKNRHLFFPQDETDLIVHPKWRRHGEMDINPHLLPEERDPVAPRYTQDLPSQKRMPAIHYVPRYKFSTCILDEQTLHSKRTGALREAEISLNKLTVFGIQRSLSPGMAKVKHELYLDWDWGGWDEPYVCEDHELGFEYGEEKVAPEATLDLLAMAKHAKKSKRHAARHEYLLQKYSDCGLTDFGPTEGEAFHNDTFAALPEIEIDEVSDLDYEETWEYLDLYPTDITLSDNDGSEWGWDRCSSV